MEKIIFEDFPSIETPINAENLNEIQTNVENAINEVDNKFNYSTEEKKIGIWVDGKPLYKRVLLGTLPSLDGNWQNVSQVGTNLVIRKMTGSLGYLPFPIWLNDEFNLAIQLSSEGYIGVLGKGFSGAEYNIIIEYTKSTD